MLSTDHSTEANQHLVHLAEMCMETSSLPVSLQTFKVLVYSCQKWIHEPSIAKKLWLWSCQAAVTLDPSETRPILAYAVFQWTDDPYFIQKLATTFGVTTLPEQWIYNTLLSHLRTKDTRVIHRVLKLFAGLPSQTGARPMLEFLDSSLSKNIIMWVSMAIRGEKIGEEDKPVPEEDEDLSDDEDEQDKLTDGKRERSANARLSRQKLQTTPRLDRIYKDDFDKLRQETIDHSKGSDMIELAESLCNASLWLDWGLAALERPEADIYLSILSRLMQGCSSFKTNTNSAFLSQLAYSEPLLEKIWRRTLHLLVNGDEEQSVLAFTIFADLFAQHLISLRDVDFLENYTTLNSSPVILAEAVIEKLKEQLYQLYWTQPVVASDFRVANDLPALRSRFFLSGTKLWNSLYERWCRLVRKSPFCDESSWWFPKLAIRDDDGAVFGGREAVPMDIEDEDDDDDDMSMNSVAQQDMENDALADTFKDPKMARLLSSIPQALPFDRRVKLFHSLLNSDKSNLQDEGAGVWRLMRMMNDENGLTGREQVQIRRDKLYEDSMEHLNKMGQRLKKKVRVTFINQHGTQEAGIDGGGVFKEFLDDLIKQAFSPQREEADTTPILFSVTPLQTLAVNMDIAGDIQSFPHFEFLGRVLGKAVYESILVEPQFCLPFLNQLLGKANSLEDLKNLDPEFYTNLMKLRELNSTELQGLGMAFELTVGNNKTIPLIPGGSSLPVTKQNVIHYVHLVAHQRLNVQGAQENKAFLRGFRDIVPASWVRLFSAYELQKIISGDDTIRGIDVASLRRTMEYSAGYHMSQPIMQWFWEVIEEMTPEQQRKFLRFMTSCSRQPLLGFQSLYPVPCIQQIRLDDDILASKDVEKLVPLPTSSTCMNLLKLPNYKNKELLRKKLMRAIESGAGFELT